MLDIKIKICGIKDLKTAEFCVKLGIDYLGFNFVPGSKREISIEIAKSILSELDLKSTVPVALFFKTREETIEKVINSGYFSHIQYVIHDTEFPRDEYKTLNLEFIPQIGVSEEIHDSDLNIDDNLCILDSFQKEIGGGSGITFPWSNAKNIKRRYLLAGGLNPENVKNAIDYLKPFGVDVASGVEDCHGNKDFEKIKRFIKNARG